jgi:hypothetical protein
MMPATSSGGNASKSKNPVTNIAQTKNGILIQVIPLALRFIIVVIKLTDPNKDEDMSITSPSNHCV